jgi:glycosyltransferase involved in cell wall biosynthesis
MHFMLADGLTRRAASLGSALARVNSYDVVVSSGPPHAAHDAARMIAAEARLPFVMDMRDPWSDSTAMPEELGSGSWERTARAHEQRCVSAARLVIVTSKAHEDLQLRKYPALRGRVDTVMNGADSDPLPTPHVGRRFLVAFAGMIYLGRNPRALFRAAARVVRETGATPEEFGVEFMGDDSCEGVPLAVIAREEGLMDHFRAHGFRPRDEALEFLAGAAALVSLPLRTTMTLPAKLFEYTRFNAWLLVLAESRSATAELLRGTDADVVEPDDEEAMVRVLLRRFEEFRVGLRPVALNRDGRFDRAKQSAKLFDRLDEVRGTVDAGARDR